ncbi:MAG: hypothetical protein E3J81_07375 [Dehalococcoidia bacterium]|nr:MAG: hypothetical protein E3J81_07375 [Dehalococcoidia bacterium]
MSNKEVTLRVTLVLDEKWASHLTRGELAEYIKERLNSSLGFRGQVKRFRLLGDKARRVSASLLA